jgi:hypothetical protein
MAQRNNLIVPPHLCNSCLNSTDGNPIHCDGDATDLMAHPQFEAFKKLQGYNKTFFNDTFWKCTGYEAMKEVKTHEH